MMISSLPVLTEAERLKRLERIKVEIERAYDQANRGELVDGEEFFRELGRKMAAKQLEGLRRRR